MRVDVVLRYVGVVMIFIALFMLLSAGISYVSGMDSAFYPLLLSSLLTALLGAFPLIFVERTEQITNKEGFCDLGRRYGRGDVRAADPALAGPQ